MSLDACIPGMIERGELTEAQGQRMRARFDKLLGHYKRQMGEAAARAEASSKTIEQLAGEAETKRRQDLLQWAAQRQGQANMDGFAGGGHNKWRSAALALFDRDWRGRASYQNVEELRRSLLGQSHAMLEGVLDKHHRGFLTGVVRKKADLEALAREAFGEASGNDSAKALAGAWTETAEWLRQRFNSAGGDIGKLDRWGFPQHHNSQVVREAAVAHPEMARLEAELKTAREGADAEAEARIGEEMIALGSSEWRAFITPLLDRSRMIDRELGVPFGDNALQEALDGVYRTIRSEGWEGRTLGAAGGAKMANRHGDPRFLIFDGADAWLKYHERFGTGSVFDVMIHHIERMSREIAHMEILGPNPTATVRWLNDLIESKRQLSPDAKPSGQGPAGALLSVDQMYQATSGALAAPVDVNLARRMGSVRSVLMAAQLGSASISAITDVGWQTMARIHRGLPITGMALDLAKQFGKGERRESVRTGLIAEEASRLLAAENRYAVNEVVGRKSAWLAERVLNLSLLGPWTQAGKWAWGRGMESTLGKFAGRPLEQVPGRFQRMLREYGVDSAAWDKVRATPLRDDGFLAPVDIADPHLRDRMLGMILMETDAAIPSATVTGRAMMSFGARPGSLAGEVARTVGQYKSFGVSLILTQGGRVMSIKGNGNKLLYLAGVNAVGMSLGLLVVWLRDLRNGEDPRPVSPTSAGQAWLQGVGFGVFGDYLQASTSERAGTFAEGLAGPTVGAAADAGQFTVGNALETASWLGGPKPNRDGSPKSWNDQTHAGREAVRLAKRYVPGTNLWYARLAAERLMFDQMQMLFDPHYEDNWHALQERHAKEGHPSWWQHGELLPSRPPEMGNTLAEPAQQ